QYCPTNSPYNSPIELSTTEGRACARPLFASHWRPSEEHEKPTITADQQSPVWQEGKGAEPTISETRRQRILELVGHGYGMLAIAKMAGVQQSTVEALIREAAA